MNLFKGDYAPIMYTKIGIDGEGLNITVEEVVKGLSDGKTFKLQLGGR